MNQFDFGWTSDDGPNVFALGWLRRIVVSFTPGGGIDDGMLRLKRLRRKTQRNVRNLMNLITLVVIADQENDGE